MKCVKCGRIIERDDLCYCPYCGNERDAKTLRYEKSYSDPKLNIENIKKFLNDYSQDRYKIAWDMTIDRYVEKVEKVKLIANHEKIKNSVTKDIEGRLENFIKQCKNPELHVAFVGVVKAGKSTLINAFFGRELASAAVTPETAALTKFRSGKGKNFIKLKFYTNSEWDSIWQDIKDKKNSEFVKEYEELNAGNFKRDWLEHEDFYEEFLNEESMKESIKKWTSSKSATHYFVKEVEVGIANFSLPDQVVLVDTPGLNDPVRYRSDLTRQYIDRANAVVLCVQAKVLSTADLETIYKVFAKCRFNPGKVFIVGSQMDLLNDPELDWEEQKEQWIKYLNGKECYGNAQLAQKNIMAVSAYYYNLLLRYNELTTREKKAFDSACFKFDLYPFNEDNIVKAKVISNIPTFKEILSEQIIAQHQKILTQDMIELFKSIKLDIDELFTLIKETQKEALEVAADSQVSIEKKRKEMVTRLKIMEKDKDTLSDSMKILREATEKRAQELYNQIKSKKIGG